MGTYYRLLTIAGSDSGGGAGIQADIKTFSALGCYGMSVISALTAQNTVGVTGIHAVPPDFVEKQIEAVLTDIGVDAVKIGMLYSVELVDAVVRQLKKHQIKTVVFDPVMVAQSGDRLLLDDAIESLKTQMMPLCTIVTPNLPEAEVLTGKKLKTLDDIQLACKQIAVLHPRSILIKGGHLDDEFCSDVLYLCESDKFVIFREARLKTKNTHGTGCTLSSAIASFLARQNSIEESVKKAKDYITGAIRSGSAYQLGKGNGPVHHFYQYWK